MWDWRWVCNECALVSPCLLGAGMKHDLEPCILEDDVCKTGLSAYIGGVV